MPDSPTGLPWAKLDPLVRDDMLQVRSILSTVVTLGREWVPRRLLVPGSFVELTASELEQVAEREHERWAARQRRIKSSNPLAAKAWSELPEDIRQREIKELVQHIAQLERAGFLPTIPLGGPAAASRYERTGYVWAWRLNSAFQWSFRPGEQLSGNPGDWYVCDDRGHVRTVTDPEFQASHEKADYGRWRRTGTFRAWKAGEPLVLRTKEGEAQAKATDMVVEGPGGERWPVPADQFNRTYRRATDGDADLVAGEDAQGRTG